MATKKKLLQAAAGAAGGAGLNVEDVFSTYLYEGNGSTNTITNDIDLSGEGGLVWIKSRDNTASHFLMDTERGVNKQLVSNATDAENNNTTRLQNFNANGFQLGDNAGVNASSLNYASWTFRKAPKFFDVVTYTGNGTAGRTVSHNLDSEVGCILIKSTSGAGDWAVYHRGVDSTAPEDYFLVLNGTDERVDATNRWNDTAPTSTEFTVGNSIRVNENGTTYVAYLFAHNDGDGEFGDGTQDIIKCGSVSYNGGASVDLGFEPQWVLIKPSNNTGNWILNDVMRGMPNGSRGPWLQADTSSAELANATVVYPTSTGFTMPAFLYDPTDLIYIAIRRGPMAVPESATDVFDVDYNTTRNTKITTGFAPDLGITKATNAGSSNDHWYFHDRLRGNAPSLWSDSTSSEQNYGGAVFDEYMDGWQQGVTNASDTPIDFAFKRAPNFFDVVAYTGNGTAGRTVSHNLGVAPEMIWVKVRNLSSGWPVWHTGKELYLNSTAAKESAPWSFNNTDPTDTSFTLNSYNSVNGSGYNYIAYLFASLDGVSKVGSYTGNGGSQTIDCGFSAGARFVLIKSTNITSSWLVFDTERGIVAGNDNALVLNSTQAEITTNDYIDPDNSGFAFDTSNALVNGNGNTYIFYAIA